MGKHMEEEAWNAVGVAHISVNKSPPLTKPTLPCRLLLLLLVPHMASTQLLMAWCYGLISCRCTPPPVLAGGARMQHRLATKQARHMHMKYVSMSGVSQAVCDGQGGSLPMLPRCAIAI